MCKRFVNVNAALCGLLCLGLLIWQLSAPAFAQGQPQAALAAKSVLVLHAFENSMPVNEVADLMRMRYGQRKVDLIVTVYADALQFVLTEGRDIFPEVPILTLYMSPGIELPKTNRRLIDHQVSYDMVGTLEIALKLVPRAKRVYVVGGIHYSEKKLQNQARRDFKKWEGQLEFRYLTDMPLEDVLNMVSNAPPGTIIFFLSFLVDSAGKTYTSRDVVQQVSWVSPAPVFGLYDILLGYGIAGGSITSYERNGTQAGQLTLDILRGTQTLANIPTVLDVSPVSMFDWRQLRHWNLSEGALPKGSIVLNKELTLWDLRYYIIGVLAFGMVETAFIIILIAQRRQKKLAEEGLLRKTEELDRFFNISLDLLCIANTEGYFLRLSPAWEKVLGYTREELMAKRFLDFVHPDDLGRTRETISILASQQKVFSFENRYRCKDGTYRWLEWSAVPFGELIYGAARDVTEYRLADEALNERLRFEELLSNISSRFVNISPDRVDSEIERGLRHVLEFFQVDRVGLVETSPDKTSFQITHAAIAKDVPAVPLRVKFPVSIYPWSYDKLIRKGEVVAYSRLDDLPPDASVDKQTWSEWGIRSNVNIPLLIGEPVDHIISINSVKSERVWPEEFIPRLRLLGETLVNALERKQIRLQIEERLRFEGLISNLSTGFVNLPPDEVDSEINKGLRSITEFFDADRCSIGLFSEDGTQFVRAFEYHSAEAEPAPESMPKEQLPWYMEQLIRGKPVVMNRIEDLPPEAENERQLCLAKGMKSLLSIPMVSGGRTLGSFALVSTLAERVWPDHLLQRFRLVSELFTNALEHKQAEEASRKSEKVLRQNENDLRGLAGRLIYAQEEERSRLARELHDDLAQRLAVFAIDVGQLEQRLVDPSAPVQKGLREMKKDIFKISQDVHSLSRQLHPSLLDDLGLIKAVESECTNFSRREGIEIVFKHENIPTVIPKDISLSLYRIIQEGLRNISKHACADHILVSLRGIDHDILLSVRDDGIGFDSAEVKEKPGLGLSSVRERVRLIQGELSIQSQPEKGTVITVRVPLTREGE